MMIRVIAALPGVLLLLSGLGWLVDPARAAGQLGMPLLDGVGRSTQIGDFGAFFLASGAMILTGAVTRKPQWLQAGALLVGCAAGMRTLAWALHGAPFAASFIGVEVAMTGVLLFAARKLADAA